MNITKEEGKQILGVLEKFRWEYGWTSNDDASYLFLQSKLSEPAHDDTALLRQALEALDDSVGLVVNDALQAEELYGRYPTRQARVAGMKKIADDHQAAITALRERLGEKVWMNSK